MSSRPPKIPGHTPTARKTHYLGSRIIIKKNGKEVEKDNDHEEHACLKAKKDKTYRLDENVVDTVNVLLK